MENIIIATLKEWNIVNYLELKKKYSNKYNFHLITNNDELSFADIEKLNPKYIFFPHWSHIISTDIYSKYECIVFHMTDLPYGRGGSPLQNLILEGVKKTKISALRVEKELDTGDIYLKEDLDISKGSAEEIFINASSVIFNKMIPKFLLDILTASKQEGNATSFKRRNEKQSDINTLNKKSLSSLYDFIRMLDAPGYPKAYLTLDSLKIRFFEVEQTSEKLVGRFEVINNE